MEKDETVLKINSLPEMYKWYVAKMLAKNKSMWAEYDTLVRHAGIQVLMERVNGKKCVHMSYTWFRSIVEKNNLKAKEAIIQGQRYNLGSGLGFIQARRVERDFRKPTVNVVETARYRKAHPGSKTTIYWLDDDYCRVGWHKLGKIKNESVYEFKICKYFRHEFSMAMFKNPSLKYKYLYFPLLSASA